MSAVEQELVDWAHRVGLVTGAAQAARLRRMRLGTLSEYAVPGATPEQLALITQWAAFICLVDDLLDRNGPTSVTGVQSLMADLTSVLETGVVAPDPACAALADLWRSTAAGASPEWRGFFAGTYRAFAEATVQETGYRAAGTALDVATYVRMRRHSITFLPVVEVTGLLRGTALSPEQHEHPLVRALREAAADAAGWSNDLASGAGELAEGQDNLVSVLALAHGIGLEAAQDRVRLLARERVDLVEELAGLAEDTGPAIAAYAVLVRDWLHGTLRWFTETGRFTSTPAVKEQL